MQAKWAEKDIYKKVQARTTGRPIFRTCMMDLRYANGDLHMGHAINKVLKDMIVRHKSMTGSTTLCPGMGYSWPSD